MLQSAHERSELRELSLVDQKHGPHQYINTLIMAGNTFGKLFKITTFGESHGKGIGVVIDGCPTEVELDLAYIQNQLNRRKPGQSKIVTQRKEADEFEILSGIFEGKNNRYSHHAFYC